MAGYYEFSPLDDFVVKEFKDREQNRGLENPGYSPYKGPLTTWTRVCSNGIFDGKSGFIMYGGTNFDDTYGFGRFDKTVMGTTADGTGFHILDSELFLHRPPPGVTSIDVELSGNTPGKFMTCKINWKCWSPDQLDYMEKFFGIPGLSMIVEFGWNNIVDTPLNLSKTENLLNLWRNEPVVGQKNGPLQKIIESSQGRHEILMGFIKNFTFSLNELGGYDCVTEILSYCDLAECLKNRNSVQKKNNIKKATVRQWIDKNINKLKMDGPIEGMPGSDKWSDSVFSFQKLQDNHKGKTAPFECFCSNTSKFYIRMDLVLILLQKFFNSQNPSTDGGFYIHDSDKVFITAHPNLKSVRDTLIIPNENAPVGYYDNIYKSDTVQGKTGDSLGNVQFPANETLKISQKSNDRVDLKKIVQSGMVGKNAKVNSFPCYGDPDRGYSGKLIDLFVDSNVVRKCFTENEKMIDGLNYLLRTISDAACGIWNFDVRPLTHLSTGLTIIDKSYKGNMPVSSLVGDNKSYTFQFGHDNSIIKNVSFSANLPNSVAMDTIGKTGTGTQNDVYQDSIKDYSGFFNKFDRMIKEPRSTNSPPENSEGNDNVGQSDSPTKKLKEMQKKALDTKYFIVKIPGGDENTSILVRLLETDEGYQKSLMIDSNPNNNAIFNGLVPGIELKIDVLGVSGLRFLDYFHITGLPTRYEKGGIFAITKIHHSVSDGNWTTSIIAGLYASSYNK